MKHILTVQMNCSNEMILKTEHYFASLKQITGVQISRTCRHSNTTIATTKLTKSRARNIPKHLLVLNTTFAMPYQTDTLNMQVMALRFMP